MSDTPRTDAAIAAYEAGGDESDFLVHIDRTMRALERELAQAIEISAWNARAALGEPRVEARPERGPWGVNGYLCCKTCHCCWGEPDSKWQEEHHLDTCAYVIARDALAGSPSEVEKQPAGRIPTLHAAAVDARNVLSDWVQGVQPASIDVAIAYASLDAALKAADVKPGVACRNQALEDAARICEEEFTDPAWHPLYRNGAIACAIKIRSIKSESPSPEARP